MGPETGEQWDIQWIAELIRAAGKGNQAALGRLLTLIESGGPLARHISGQVSGSASGHARVVGITGAPGTGKSTLCGELISILVLKGFSVAVLAVDPSSPISGGAILGDRVRMQRHAGNKNVFIRSIASRGSLGGVAVAVPEAIRLLDAVGMDLILVETVGVGQSEVEISRLADTTIVVVTPGMGDGVQAAKAGLLETADIFLINKSDMAGAENACRYLRQMLGSVPKRVDQWVPPIVPTNGLSGEGLEEVWTQILAHGERFEGNEGWRHNPKDERFWRETKTLAKNRIDAAFHDALQAFISRESDVELSAAEMDPFSAADEILKVVGSILSRSQVSP